MDKKTTENSINFIIDDLIQIITKIECEDKYYRADEIKFDLAGVVADYQKTDRKKVLSEIKKEIDLYCNEYA
jgi:formylmethanofuran dehydrogenase subunit B